MATAVSAFNAVSTWAGRCSSRMLALSLIFVATLCGASAHADDAKPPLPWVEAREEALPVPEAGQYVFRFTGAGGFYLGSQRTAILVDPFLSNPEWWQVLSLRPLQTDTATVDRYLPVTANIRAVLVGHAHYDHALDVPYVMTRLPPEAHLYGSETLNNLVASQVPESRRVNVEPHMARDGSGGAWISVTPALRVFPIASEHSPHVGHWVVASGDAHEASSALPDDSLDWKAGTTLSYLVDFLDDGGRVSYRVFVQTSSSNPPKGVPPAAVLADGYPVNLAVVCAANFTNVKDYPETLLAALQPRQVVIVHWEKFWEPWELNKGTPLPRLDLDAFYARIRAAVPPAEVKLPQRGAQFLLTANPPPGGFPHGQ